MKTLKTTAKVTGYLKACIVLLIINIFTIASCDKTPNPPDAKILIRKPVVVRRAMEGFVIRKINPDGSLLIGKPETKLGFCLYAFPGHIDKPFKLEGKAQLGDPATLVTHYEDQYLESGQVRRVVVGYGVISQNNELWDKKFPTPHTSENNPQPTHPENSGDG